MDDPRRLLRAHYERYTEYNRIAMAEADRDESIAADYEQGALAALTATHTLARQFFPELSFEEALRLAG